ncbi:MAG: hypothetical protein QG662_1944 [Pseudomonadota bacterium]|nr:hypothetical protein [Pseudomonadota bacterium]
MSAPAPEARSELQSFLGFARRKIEGGLTAQEKDKMVRALLLLLNGSPKAHRLARMVDRREISGDTLLELIG